MTRPTWKLELGQEIARDYNQQLLSTAMLDSRLPRPTISLSWIANRPLESVVQVEIDDEESPWTADADSFSVEAVPPNPNSNSLAEPLSTPPPILEVTFPEPVALHQVHCITNSRG